MRRSLVWIVGSLATLGLVAVAIRFERRAVSADLATARDLHTADYVGSTACRRCHEAHYQSWGRTFHRTMTTEATPANVKGDFSGATLQHAGVTARMDRDAHGGFQMTFATDGGGAPKTAAVVRAVGSRRYQQYLAREGDALWRLPVAFNLEEKRWFPMTGAFLFADDSRAPGDPSRPVYGGGVFDRHVTRWNDNCVFCHNVAPNPGRDPETGGFRTTVAELGIACESCHGPGGEHVARNADPLRRYALHLAPRADPTIVNPSRLSPARAADVCGRCHGQRIADDVGPFLRHGDPFVAGDALALYSAPLWHDTTLGGGDRVREGELRSPELDAGGAGPSRGPEVDRPFAARFWGDGTPRLTAYEYQGLLQSRCAIGGLTCTSCHGMHEGDPRGQVRAAFAGDGPASDKMCTGCHVALAAPAAVAAHAHHDPAREGGRCVNCHMPRIVYGVLDVHRSHRIDIPSPAVQGAAGRPDACTNCHTFESITWAEAKLRQWRGAEMLAGGPAAGPPVIELLRGDPVTKAVAAAALGRSPPPAAADRAMTLGVLLNAMAFDRYPAVRHIAWRSLRKLLASGSARARSPDEYTPSGDAATRLRDVRRIWSTLRGTAEAPDPVAVFQMRKEASLGDVEIGE